MFINKQQRIDIYSDSVTTALLKKTENKDLSKKTLNKLVKIANSHIGLTKAEAKNVFIKNKSIEKNAYSMKLAFELKKVFSQCSNHELRDKIGSFIRNCNTTTFINTENSVPTNTINQTRYMSSADFVEAYSDNIGPTIGEGAEAIVVEDARNDHKVLKIFFDSVEDNEIINQANSFNMFYGKNTAHVISGRAIHMDKIEGAPLSQIKEFPVDATTNFMSLIAEMVTKSCAPSDMSENNFLYDKERNIFLPVDISANRENKVDKSGLKYIINYIMNKSVG
ncbi:hypothetical protein LU631_21140 [Erwinia tracheiphila]|uniref:Kinase OspG kinase domain-containing protein n=1 Tax=Erwinia tracheiphila TaxID=65700 RepID=A0A0M2KAF9_9GAMM|nr:hypothetical protein [Erwinia tracheiphila]AXF77033.1 hypothetical protein AV903_15020 [Erwinia tracheiphila]EOS93887.1 hypothetical protein ETR_16822 [Erwinia tracheiphila PSU-1]KKF35914.1 hypothetical protein SY86_11535 [Erwinia tracheiphila]UIA84282.1 hypothetical protein LU604_04335 [Erwinia tracheiphila]UIA87233.1 hypothetical protein LU631_21140 [Erwinia tracheiphila]